MLMLVHRLAAAVECVLLLTGEATLNIQNTKILLEADVVICELAHVVVVHANNLSLLSRAHAEEGDEVHDPEDDRGHDEGVGEASGRIGELVAELDPVMVEPAAVNHGNTVEAGNRRLREESGKDVADDSADSVDSEDIESIIVVEEELELGSDVASSSANNTVEDSGGWR